MGKRWSFEIEGMHCPSCALNIERSLSKTKGVLEARINFTTRRGEVIYDAEAVDAETLRGIVEALGYRVVEGRREEEGRLTLFLLGLALSLPIALMKLHFNPPGEGLLTLLLATPVQFLVGLHFYRGALNALRSRRLNMDVLVALSTTAAYLYSLASTLLGGPTFYEASSLTITTITLGVLLEEKATRRAGESIERLMALQPKTARVLRPLSTIRVDLLSSSGCPGAAEARALLQDSSGS